MVADLEHQIAGAAELGGDGGEDRCEGFAVLGAPQGDHVVMGQFEVDLGEGHLHLGDEHAEEGPTLIQQLQEFHLGEVACHLLMEGHANAVPAGEQEAALGPAEHPGDGTKAREILGAALAAGRTARDLQLADFLDRRDLLEEGH